MKQTTPTFPAWRKISMASALLAVFGAAHAGSDAPAPESAPPETAVTAADLMPPETPIATGRATRHWLAKQDTGQDASSQSQNLSGPAMKRAHERYLKSFEQPIPARFDGGTRLTQ